MLQVLRIGIDFPYQVAWRVKYALDDKGDVPSQEFFQLVAQFVQDQFKKNLGVDIGLDMVDAPTYAARFTSGLSACDFLRRSSVLSFTKEGLAEMTADVLKLAEVEGLTAHAASVAIRGREEGR